MTFDLLHDDESCLVVEKPSGMLAVPGRFEPDCLATRVQARFPDALIVHRLDMATSGLMLFARGPDAQRALSLAFEQRRVDKRYVAVVHGDIACEQGQIDLPLSGDWPNRPRQKVDHQLGRPSLTRYRVIDVRAGQTRVELEPVTGRAHQLRVHLLAIGHPIVGDALYAPRPLEVDGGKGVDARGKRMLLHARRLCFEHPMSGETIEIESPVPF